MENENDVTSREVKAGVAAEAEKTAEENLRKQNDEPEAEEPKSKYYEDYTVKEDTFAKPGPDGAGKSGE